MPGLSGCDPSRGTSHAEAFRMRGTTRFHLEKPRNRSMILIRQSSSHPSRRSRIPIVGQLGRTNEAMEELRRAIELRAAARCVSLSCRSTADQRSSREHRDPDATPEKLFDMPELRARLHSQAGRNRERCAEPAAPLRPTKPEVRVSELERCRQGIR